MVHKERNWILDWTNTGSVGKMAKFGGNKFRQHFSKCIAGQKSPSCIVLQIFLSTLHARWCTLQMGSLGTIGSEGREYFWPTPQMTEDHGHQVLKSANCWYCNDIKSTNLINLTLLRAIEMQMPNFANCCPTPIHPNQNHSKYKTVIRHFSSQTTLGVCFKNPNLGRWKQPSKGRNSFSKILVFLCFIHMFNGSVYNYQLYTYG